MSAKVTPVVTERRQMEPPQSIMTTSSSSSSSKIVKPKARKTQELIQEEAERLFKSQQQQQELQSRPAPLSRARVSSVDRRDVMIMDSDGVIDDDDDGVVSSDDDDSNSNGSSSLYFQGNLLSPPNFPSPDVLPSSRSNRVRRNSANILSEDEGDTEDDEKHHYGRTNNNGIINYASSDAHNEYSSDEDDINSEMEEIEKHSVIAPLRNYKNDHTPVFSHQIQHQFPTPESHPQQIIPANHLPIHPAPSIESREITSESTYTVQMVYSEDEEDEHNDYHSMHSHNSVTPLPDPKRWLMLFYISSLNLISDWVCYSMAPIATFTKHAYSLEDPENLVVAFLGANALATVCEPLLLKLIGFRGITILGSGLLMIGNLCKSTLIPGAKGNGSFLFVAFFLAGLSQPLYQCTPTLLSSSWFPDSERTMATGIALNSNQLGIGVAFVAGTLFVSKEEEIFSYLNFIAICSVFIFIGACLQFQSKPDEKQGHEKEIQPLLSQTQLENHNLYNSTSFAPVANQEFSTQEKKKQDSKLGSLLKISDITMSADNYTNEEGEFIGTSLLPLLYTYFSQKGFFHSTVAFVLSAVVINTLSTYMDILIRLQHSSARLIVGVIGGTFQFIILLSSLYFGSKTDKSRAYYSITMFLLVSGAFALAQCGIYLDSGDAKLRWYLLGVAVLVGPLQPIAGELGVDVTYPLGENGVLVIHQLFANLASAAFIPIFEKLAYAGQTPYSISFYCLVCIHAMASLIFASFNGRYRRLESERRKKLEKAGLSGNITDTDRSDHGAGAATQSEYEDEHTDEEGPHTFQLHYQHIGNSQNFVYS